MLDLDKPDTDAFLAHDTVIAMLVARARARRVANAVLASTDVLLPSGTTFVAVIEGGKSGGRITVNDAGAALAQVSEIGLEITDRVITAARSTAGKFGLLFEQGILRSQPGEITDAVADLILFANAVRDVSVAAIHAAKIHDRSRFRERIRAALGRIFQSGSVQTGATLEGASSDHHRYDYLIHIEGEQRLVLDVPVPDHNSVAAVTLRQLDLKAMAKPDLHQAIAYDDADKWPSASLAQLRLAQVPVIRANDLERGLRSAAGIPA